MTAADGSVSDLLRLPSVVLSCILDFTGGGQYIWIASSARALQHQYESRYGKRSSYASALESQCRLQLARKLGLRALGIRSLHGSAEVRYAVGSAGSRDMLLWTKSKGVRWDSFTARGVAAHGSFALLQWLIAEQTCPYDRTEIAAAAAKRGHLRMFRSCIRSLPQEYFASIAAEHGHVHLFEWLQGAGWSAAETERLLPAATKAGRTDAIVWLREQNRASGTSYAATAAEHGHLQLLQWMQQQGWLAGDTSKVLIAAAKGGHTQVLAWLRDQGCAWDAKILGQSWRSCSSTAEAAVQNMCSG